MIMSDEGVRVTAVPGGFLISGLAVREIDLRERWLRTRSDFLVRILQQNVRRIDRNHIPLVDEIRRALVSVLQEYEQKKDGI